MNWILYIILTNVVYAQAYYPHALCRKLISLNILFKLKMFSFKLGEKLYVHFTLAGNEKHTLYPFAILNNPTDSVYQLNHGFLTFSDNKRHV